MQNDKIYISPIYSTLSNQDLFEKILPMYQIESPLSCDVLYEGANDSYKIKSLEDNVSEIQIEETSNLIYLAGAAIVSPVVDTDGTLTVDDETDGDITVLLKPRASKELGAKDYYYDVQIVRADETVTTLRTGTFSVTQDVTRAVS